MTDLQISLLGAAGVFVAGVFTYNKWQEHKAKKTVERAFASDHDDVLMRAGEVRQVVGDSLRVERRLQGAAVPQMRFTLAGEKALAEQ